MNKSSLISISIGRTEEICRVSDSRFQRIRMATSLPHFFPRTRSPTRTLKSRLVK